MFLDIHGDPEKVELVECDANETNAIRFAKLYNLQIPTDMRNKVQFNHVGVRVY